jgi:hypothetical protein
MNNPQPVEPAGGFRLLFIKKKDPGGQCAGVFEFRVLNLVIDQQLLSRQSRAV